MTKTTPDLLDMENFERWEKGQPLKEERPPKIAEPKAPEVKDQLTLESLDVEKVGSVLSGKRKGVRNREGVMFIGFDITLKMKDGKKVSGWMAAKDFHEFRLTLHKKGEVSLDKISL